MGINSGPLNGFTINGSPAAAGMAAPVTAKVKGFTARYIQFQAGAAIRALDVTFGTRGRVTLPWAAAAPLHVHMFWEAEDRLKVDFEWIARLPDDLRVAWGAKYSILGRITFPWEAESPLVPDRVNQFWEAEAPLQVHFPWDGGAPMIERITAPWETEYNLTTRVTLPWTAIYNINAFEFVTSPWRLRYSLLDEAIVNVTNAITVTLIDGSPIPIKIQRGDVYTDEGSFLWQCTLVLADPGDVSLFQFDSRLQIDLYGELYEFIVDTITINRTGPAQANVTIRGLSPTADLDVPRADRGSFDFATAQSANAIVDSLTSRTVDWQVLNWTFPASIVQADGTTPVELAQQIAQSVGGLLETNPDGTMYVRYLYPISPLNYAANTPVHTYTETGELLALAETNQPAEIVDQIRIGDGKEDEFSDRLVFEPDEDDGKRGTLYLYAAPFGPRTVRNSGPPTVFFPLVGEQVIEQEECVEFVAGRGSVTLPIDTLVSVEWLTDDEGPLTFTQYGTEFETAGLLGDDGYTLAMVKYNARAYVYDVESPDERKVQFISETI